MSTAKPTLVPPNKRRRRTLAGRKVYAPTDESRAKAEKFLRVYEEVGASFGGYQKFCDSEIAREQGLPKFETIHKWRYCWEGFRIAMDSAAERVRLIAAGGLSEAQAVEETFPEIREDWKRVFLEKLRLDHDHVRSSNVTGHNWWEVEEQLATDPLFEAAYKKVMGEKLRGVKDAHLRQALEGKSAPMISYLEANAPEYQKKIKVDHTITGLALDKSAAMRPRWVEIHARHQRALPQRLEEPAEVVEAEIVGAPP